MAFAIGALPVILGIVHAAAGVVWVYASAGLVWVSVRRPRVATTDGSAELSGILPALGSAALVVLLVTGIWNVTSLGDASLVGQYGTVLTVKLALAAASFAAGIAYRRVTARSASVMWALAALVTGAAALSLGFTLDGGHVA